MAYSACTTISRTNVGSNSVLTSSKYNTDLNTAYTAINSSDGECIQNGTILKDALSTSDFGVVLDGITEGCKITRSDAATISVGRCRMSINGNFVETTSANTVTWGCTGCSAEANSTDYYVYVKPTSEGTTLNLLISTGVPNEDGYDGSSNKAIGKFYNDSSGDIDANRVWQWMKNETQDDLLVSRVQSDGMGQNIPKLYACSVNTNSQFIDSTMCDPWIATVGNPASGSKTWTFASGIFDTVPVCVCNSSSGAAQSCNTSSRTTSGLDTWTGDTGSGFTGNYTVELMCFGRKL